MQQKTLREMIFDKTKWGLKAYCEVRNLPYESLKCGYISKATASALDADEIEWEKAKNVYVRGGSCGAFKRVNA